VELGELSHTSVVSQSASIQVKIRVNALRLDGVEVELRPGAIKWTDARGECKFSSLAPGRYGIYLKGQCIWQGKVREADELTISVVTSTSYMRCCHVPAASDPSRASK
jgi:hypothetical protein